MASNTLTSNSVSSTYTQILHIGTGTAGVSTVRTGDGTTTVLSFVSGGAKITGTFEVTTNLTVGGTLAVTGAITGIGIPVFKVITAADINNSSSSVYTDLTELSFTPVSGATYEIEMCFVFTAAATTTGVVVKNNGGGVTGALITADNQSALIMGAELIYSSSPYATPTKFGQIRKGTVVTSSTAPITWQIRSEVNASQITLFIGSYLKITRIS